MGLEFGDNITKSYNKVDDFLDGLEKNSKNERLDIQAAFKEGKIIIRRIEKSLDEYDKGTNEYNELKGILNNAVKEYKELERVIIQSGYSEQRISQDERREIMLELSDLIQIEETQKDITDNFRWTDKVGGWFDSFGWGVSEDRVEKIIIESRNERSKDKNRLRKEAAKDIVNNAQTFFNEAKKQELSGDKIYQIAFHEELENQKNEFDKSYKLYLNGEISLEQLESEMDDIELLNINELSSALLEGVSYFFGNINIFGDDTINIEDSKKRLSKMNLIYLASRANNLSGTETFKNERDIVANEIAEYEVKQGKSIGKHETIGSITYDSIKIKQNILQGEYNNIDKYELYFYLQNEHSNFSNTTVQQLLTQYPRDFVRYISGQFLDNNGIMSALFGKENKKFLNDLKNINKVLELSHSQDINLATQDLNSNEIIKAKEQLNNKESRDKLVKQLAESPVEEMNENLKKLREYAIIQSITDYKSHILKDKYNTNEFTFIIELEKYIPEIIEQNLHGDKLIEFIIEKFDSNPKFSKISKSNLTELQHIFQQSTNTQSTLLNETIIQSTKDNKSLLAQNIIQTTMQQQEINNRVELINIQTEEEFKNSIDMIIEGSTFNDIDKYYYKNSLEYRKLLEKHQDEKISLENNLNEQYGNFTKNNSKEINVSNQTKTYSYAGLTYEIPDVAVNNNFSIINYQTGEKIEISHEEKQTVEKNPEALKNLIDTKQKLEMLGLDFVWNFRDEFISLSGEILGTNGINNLDKNFIDKNELNKILNLVLNIAGYSGDTGSISGTYAKIILLNGVGSLNNKKDTNTGLSNIGMIFKSDKVGFLNNKDSLQTNWKSNVLKNYKH